MMLPLLLGRYFIAQNMKSACAGTPNATVLFYWESSQFNSTILFQKTITAPSEIFTVERPIFYILACIQSLEFTVLLSIPPGERQAKIWALSPLSHTQQSHTQQSVLSLKLIMSQMGTDNSFSQVHLFLIRRQCLHKQDSLNFEQ